MFPEPPTPGPPSPNTPPDSSRISHGPGAARSGGAGASTNRARAAGGR
ncbi:SYT5 isoform 9 [Pongo abelii]|uniref:SYT5 isoform 9 n=1 Tax=Pongo abelii TaxID=9601 RepID=A0A2J8R072_PONAB|nr:SYT5 isoform 9 [Pongo abelii]